jgi:hypothetical protein
VATARGYDPATQTMVIEAIFLGSNSRQQDFVGHSPILSFAKLRLAPDKLRHDTKSPMADYFIGGKMVLVG